MQDINVYTSESYYILCSRYLPYFYVLSLIKTYTSLYRNISQTVFLQTYLGLSKEDNTFLSES